MKILSLKLLNNDPRHEKTGFLHICKNKNADQLREADQRLCFRYICSTIPILPKSEITSLYSSSVAVQPVCVGLGQKPGKPIFLQRRSNALISITLSTLPIVINAL